MVKLQRKLKGEKQQQSSEYQDRCDIHLHIPAAKGPEWKKRKFAREIAFLGGKECYGLCICH